MAASQNDLIRAYQAELVKKGVDLSVKSTRQEHLAKFLKAHPDLSVKSATAAWSHLLPKTAKEAGIDPEKVRSAKRVRVRYDKKTLNQHIDAHPVEEPTGQQQGPNWKTGGQQQQQQQGQQGQPPPGQQGPNFYSQEAVAAFFVGLHSTIRIMVPDAEPLAKEQTDALGGIWQGEFNKRLAGHENASLLLAVVATLGIFGTNLHAGIKKGRERRDAEEQKKGSRESARKAADEFAKKKREDDDEPLPANTPLEDLPAEK